MGAAADVGIVGAGPCGLAAAAAMRRAGLDAILIDRSCLVSGIASYPTFINFFSTADRLSIAGIPFVVPTEKPTRRDALAYYRAVAKYFDVPLMAYENVVAAERRGERFRLCTLNRHGEESEIDVGALVVATGYFGHPNRLGVPGEDLPHVTHLFKEGHWSFDLDVVVAGGGNSAVEAALDLYRADARVTIVHFAPSIDPNVKPWIVPDIMNRIKEGTIQAHFDSRISAIEPHGVVLETPRGARRVKAEQVYLMLGYQPNNDLLLQLGVPIDSGTGIPEHDPATMETAIPGLFIAGVIASGYDANKTFIENGRQHGELIARKLTGSETPAFSTSPSA